ncbi:MAG TPA: proline dehydrogenase family protein [Gemmatimonadaceae bacterium]|nr:proline dehydrogenase family protein [Gemmatimonadaceae bacterium]
MLREILIHLSENRLARKVSMSAPGARTVARRFVAGESLDDGVVATRELNRNGLTVTLDYLGESVSSRGEATAAADTYIAALERIAGDGLDANVSLKLTQMGQDIDTAFLRENVGRVLDRARDLDIFVRFDMESSEYTQRTIDFFRSLWDEGYRNIGIVLQSYLYRCADDARMAIELGARVRLCKGAYQEPESVAYQDKADVDGNFVRVMQMLIPDAHYPAIATHDEAMLEATRKHVEATGTPHDSFEFQMLYGVRRDFQNQLRDAGYKVRVYVPFGEAWYPYLMRRMAERPANLMFIVNALVAESPLRFLRRRRKDGWRSS